MVNVDFRVVVLKKPSVCQGFLTENRLPPGVPVQDPMCMRDIVDVTTMSIQDMVDESFTGGFGAKGTGVSGARESWGFLIFWVALCSQSVCPIFFVVPCACFDSSSYGIYAFVSVYFVPSQIHGILQFSNNFGESCCMEIFANLSAGPT